MASNGTLFPSTVDIYLRAVDETPGGRSGPVGRLLDAKNVVVTQYDPGQGKAQRIKAKQRNGFATMTTNGHSAETGVSVGAIDFSNPELLSTLGNQLLSICNAIPRVYDGTDWTEYATERVVTNVLTESVFHTSQRTVTAPDQAWKNGVTCSTWTEETVPATTTGIVYIGFRSDDGTWVRPPAVLYDPEATGDHIVTVARVIADAAADFFWVCFDSLVTGDPRFTVKLFSLDGREVASNSTVHKEWVSAPGYWDITRLWDGGMLLAQPLHPAADNADGVRIAEYTQAASVISVNVTDNEDVHCRGPVAWLTNDSGDERWYLATIGLGEEPGGRLWAYQFTLPAFDPATHEYDFNLTVPGENYPDSLIGAVLDSGDPDEPSVLVSYTVLSLEAQTVGPVYDPQLRYNQSYTCTWGDVSTFQRQSNSTCQVSRAFRHDDEYYSINYYQSGSGRQISNTQVTVAFTAGDYMKGDQVQPIEVRPGDYTTGSPHTYIAATGNAIITTASVGSAGITNTDTVEETFVPAGVAGSDGAVRCLKWSFAGLSVSNATIAGSRLRIASSSIPTADGDWDVIGTDLGGTHAYVFTVMANTLGGTVVPGTFTATGTREFLKMTYYQIFDLRIDYNPTTTPFLIGGNMVVTGNSGANNGTKTIARAITTRNNPSSLGYDEGIWIVTGSETSSFAGFTAVVNPLDTNLFHFAGDFFDAADEGANLVIAGDSVPTNNGPFPITDGDTQDVTVDATAITAEIYTSTQLPTVTVELPPDITPFTFFLQDIDPDYSFLNATLVVQSDTVHDQNNGVYTIIDIDPDPANHIVYCRPADGRTGQRNQEFIPDDQVITIIFQANVQPEYQPTWLMVPLTGSKPVVGRFEQGIAFADWRFEGRGPSLNDNVYPLHVMSPVRGNDRWLWMLPYRAISFTAASTIVTVSGQVVNAATTTNAATVGLKQFYLSDETGLATAVSNSLALPGPMCGEFTSSGFHEQGVNFGFEAPFLVEQDTSANGVALIKGGTYQYVAVAEVSDENGDRVFSIVSPPLDVRLSGDNDVAVIGGRLLQPLDEDGVQVSQHFGVTNWRLLGISLYRTAIIDGVPTTEHHKITSDLNVNALAPVSDVNDSGFEFPDEFTWNYRDENLDAAIANTEILYTDKGLLPRFPAPAQRQGVLWKDCEWVIGYDGAVWKSAQKKEGDATWYVPLWRFTQAIQDEPVALAPMDDYLLVFCRKGVWYIPAANFPDATGRNGSLPAMVKTTFTNGCTGFAVPIQDGVAYSSTAGGVWLVTRGLKNFWLSQPYQNQIGSTPITGLAVDGLQRLIVGTPTGNVFVYDQVVQLWARWALPTSAAKHPAIYYGQPVIQDPSHRWLYDTGIYADNLTGSPVAVPIDLTLSSLQFGNVRSVKRVWEMQIIGEYKGPHNLNAEISYPDDDPDNPTVFPDPADGPYTPDPDAPYLMAINPMIEEASSYGLRIFTDFTGHTPGNACEIELISCEVGLDSAMGLNKRPASARIPGANG